MNFAGSKAKGTAVIGMKVLGLGRLGTIYDKALRYAFALPVDTVIVGMESMEQLQKNWLWRKTINRLVTANDSNIPGNITQSYS